MNARPDFTQRHAILVYVRHLYEGDGEDADRFRHGLLAFDLLTMAFIVVSSFLPRTDAQEWLDVIFGLVILADFIARLLVSHTRARDLLQFTTAADLIAIVSFIAPIVGEGAGFLRALRFLRLLRNYQLLARLRAENTWFRSNEELFIACVQLVVFFCM